MASPSTSFDVIVVGLGAMGSATCHHLARRGVSVLGIEQFDIPHGLGSSHGFSRITRLAYYEHPDYVPLLRRSLTLWDELEAELGQTVFHRIGCLSIGPADGEILTGIGQSVMAHALSHERLTHSDLARRYPQFHLPEHFAGVLDLAGGALLPERIVAGFAELAMRRGAVLHGRETVTGWQADGSGVRVTTSRNQTYSAARVVFCGGPWSTQLVGHLGVKLVVSRQVQGWVWPKFPEHFTAQRLPVWILDQGGGDAHYGFPMLSDNPGFKLATHTRGDICHPDSLRRTPDHADEQTFRPCLEKFIPDANGPLLSMRVCM